MNIVVFYLVKKWHVYETNTFPRRHSTKIWKEQTFHFSLFTLIFYLFTPHVCDAQTWITNGMNVVTNISTYVGINTPFPAERLTITD